MPRSENDGLPVSSWELRPGDMKEIEGIALKIKEHLTPSS
jgi:hypothetical protein